MFGWFAVVAAKHTGNRDRPRCPRCRRPAGTGSLVKVQRAEMILFSSSILVPGTAVGR